MSAQIEIHRIICRKCGHETSGPNRASVEETAKRHQAKMHSLFKKGRK